MKNPGKVVLHIPAREGSKRVPRKNLRDLNGKPMINYTVESALNARVTEYNYVNTDSTEIIEYIIKEFPDMGIYKRDVILASDKAQSDDFNADIIRKLDADTLIMINPVCPLIEAQDIKAAFEAYLQDDCDTLISSTSTQMQTFCEGKPVNINLNEPLAASQQNPIVTILNWAITIWDAKLFLQRFEKNGHAVWGEKMLFYDIEHVKSAKVSEEKDFVFAELLLKARNIVNTDES